MNDSNIIDHHESRQRQQRGRDNCSRHNKTKQKQHQKLKKKVSSGWAHQKNKTSDFQFQIQSEQDEIQQEEEEKFCNPQRLWAGWGTVESTNEDDDYWHNVLTGEEENDSISCSSVKFSRSSQDGIEGFVKAMEEIYNDEDSSYDLIYHNSSDEYSRPYSINLVGDLSLDHATLLSETLRRYNTITSVDDKSTAATVSLPLFKRVFIGRNLTSNAVLQQLFCSIRGDDNNKNMFEEVHVEFHHNGKPVYAISDDDIECLIESLQHNKDRLAALSIRNRILTTSDEKWGIFVQGLSQSPMKKLTKLSLNGISLSAQDSMILTHYFQQQCESLKTLRLDRIECGAGLFYAVNRNNRGRRNNKSLKYLHIRGSKLNPQGMAQFLRESRALESLQLQACQTASCVDNDNKISNDEGYKPIFNVLGHTSLQFLTWNNTPLDMADIQCLAQSLVGNQSLKKIDLAHSFITEDTNTSAIVEAITTILIALSTPQPNASSYSSIREIKVSPFQRVLYEPLTLPTITNNNITDVDNGVIHPFIQSIWKLPKLRQIRPCYATQMNQELAKALLHGLEGSSSLIHFSAWYPTGRGNNEMDNICRQIQAHFRWNSMYQKIIRTKQKDLEAKQVLRIRRSKRHVVGSGPKPKKDGSTPKYSYEICEPIEWSKLLPFALEKLQAKPLLCHRLLQESALDLTS